MKSETRITLTRTAQVTGAEVYYYNIDACDLLLTKLIHGLLVKKKTMICELSSLRADVIMCDKILEIHEKVFGYDVDNIIYPRVNDTLHLPSGSRIKFINLNSSFLERERLRGMRFDILLLELD